MSILSNGIRSSTDTPSSSASVTQARTFRTGNSTITLREGQTLKGVVSNVHGNEITLSMDDGSSFTGKLPDANQYSIGQKAAFLITNLNDNTIYMKALGNTYLLDMEDTMEQALEEAGLPKTDRNIDVVRSLLNNQQSISRENILASLRTCAKFPQADVDCIITMQRLHLPLTQANVEQFENYKNQAHQLLHQMSDLTDSLGNMMSAIGTQVPRFAKETATQLIDLALSAEVTPEEEALTASMELKTSLSVSGEEAETALAAGVMEEISETGEAEDSTLSPEATASAKEDAEALTAADKESAEAGKNSSPLAKMKQLFTSLTDGGDVAKAALSESEIIKSSRSEFIHEQSGFLLSPDEREQFADFLKDYPLPDSLKEAVMKGSITAREFLGAIRDSFSQMSEEQASRLLSSKPFQSMVKGQFMSNWTISPEHMKDKGSMETLYRQMAQQFDTLSHFSEKLLGKDVFSDVTKQATQMNDNLDFMKVLNDTFQYVQLPVKMQNQNTHGDLYVMTRKESLRKHPDKLKVLLHLDMEHLGTLDIHISRDGNSVDTKFFVDNEETHHLLARNIEMLQDAINEQGYAFHSELAMKEQNMDIVKDFIGADAPVGNMTRYNFDLRA